MLALGLLAVLGGGWCYWLWRSEPVYWQQHAQYIENTTPEARMATAQAVEQRLLDEISYTPAGDGADSGGNAGGTAKAERVASGVVERVADTADGKGDDVDPDAPREVFLSIREINAWVDQRLDQWVKHQGSKMPGFIQKPMLTVEDDHLVIAFRFVHPPIDQIISVLSDVEIEPDKGQAVMRVRGVRGGRLRIPGVKAVTSAVQDKAGEGDFKDIAAKVTEAFDGRSFDPLLDLNNRKIRLVGFELQPEGVKLIIRPVVKPKD